MGFKFLRWAQPYIRSSAFTAQDAARRKANEGIVRESIPALARSESGQSGVVLIRTRSSSAGAPVRIEAVTRFFAQVSSHALAWVSENYTRNLSICKAIGGQSCKYNFKYTSNAYVIDSLSTP